MTLLERLNHSIAELEALPVDEHEAWDKANPQFRQDVTDMIDILVALGDNGDMHVRQFLADMVAKLELVNER